MKWYRHFHGVLLQNEDGLVEYFEAVLKATKKEPRNVIGWVTNELLGHLKQQDMSVSQRWDKHRHAFMLLLQYSHNAIIVLMQCYSAASAQVLDAKAPAHDASEPIVIGSNWNMHR